MISLLIPTLNRSSFIIRYLNYLNNNNFEGAVYIGDSSNQEHFDKTRCAIARIKPKFEMAHIAYPGLLDFECILKMLPSIKTPYAMYMCDDDFLVCKSVKKAIAFLENNPIYSGVTGKGIFFNIRGDGAFGPIGDVIEDPLRGYEQDKPRERLSALFNIDYRPVNALSRTDQFVKRWIDRKDFRLKELATEVLPWCLMVVHGKVKKLDELFMVRQQHGQRYLLPDVFDTLATPEWLPSSLIFQDEVAKVLNKYDDMDLDEAIKFVRGLFKRYWIDLICYKFGNSKKREKRAKLKEKLKKIKVLRQLVQKGRIIKSVLRNEPSLTTLSRPSSPYYEDFSAIVTACKNEI